MVAGGANCVVCCDGSRPPPSMEAMDIELPALGARDKAVMEGRSRPLENDPGGPTDTGGARGAGRP